MASHEPSHGRDECLEALLVLEPAPRDDKRRVDAGAGDAGGAERDGSTPFGTIVILSRQLKRPHDFSTMKPEQQITRWAS
jgi:hypothetical protein